MWEPRCLRTLWAFTACYRPFFFLLIFDVFFVPNLVIIIFFYKNPGRDSCLSALSPGAPESEYVVFEPTPCLDIGRTPFRGSTLGVCVCSTQLGVYREQLNLTAEPAFNFTENLEMSCHEARQSYVTKLHRLIPYINKTYMSSGLEWR
jgi:hypothetical protein